MITFGQAKTLKEGQVVYAIKNGAIKEVLITSIKVFKEAGSAHIFYKCKKGKTEYAVWAHGYLPAYDLYLTKEEVAKDYLSDLEHLKLSLEDELKACQQKIEKTKKFGGII